MQLSVVASRRPQPDQDDNNRHESSRIAKETFELLGPQLLGRLLGYLPTATAPSAFRRLATRGYTWTNRIISLTGAPP